MKVIKLLVPYTSTIFGIQIPELSLACDNVLLKTRTSAGEFKSFVVTMKKAASIQALQDGKYLPADGELTEAVCSEKISGSDENGNPILVNNPIFTEYFSPEAIALAGGDILNQAINFYRNSYMASMGIPLQITEIVTIE